MNSLLNIIIFFWCVIIIKSILFWVFLWQLKNYHIGRFADHFTTQKGKKVLGGPFPVVKCLVLFLLLLNYSFFPTVLVLLVLIYGAESMLFMLHIATKTIKKPVLTAKAIFLIFTAFLIAMAYFSAVYAYGNTAFWFIFGILLFDVLSPLIISAVVLLFQPFFVMARNNLLEKATKKMAAHKKVVVIGITGSYGKTSAKEFLTTLLSKKFNVLATPEHKNSEVGIAQTILSDLNDKHQIFIVEMGAYNKGGIKLLCDIVKPSIGIVTGVNVQHLATFGSLENLLSAEGGWELLASLPSTGMLVVNGDNSYCVDLYKKANLKKKMYTLGKDAISSDIWTEDIAVGKDSLSFIARSKEGQMAHFDVKVLGKQQAQNMLAAILVAEALGMSFEEISLACKSITPKQAGMNVRSGVHGIHIIDASYSSNPDGVMADLDYLSVFSQKKVMVMPCLIELGIKSEEIHKQIGKKIAEVCDLAIITTQERFEDIKKGAVENGMPKDKIIFSDNPKNIFHTITTFCKEGDAVLLEGGRPKKIIDLLHNDKPL